MGKRRAVGIEVVAEHGRTEDAEHMARIALLEQNIYELKGKLYLPTVAITSLTRDALC